MIVGIAELALDVFSVMERRRVLEDGCDASGLEAFVAFVIAFKKVMGMVTADRFSKDGAGIVVVENEDVTYVTVGGDRKLTWEVRANTTLKVLSSKGGSAYLVVAVGMVLWWGEGAHSRGRGTSRCAERTPWQALFIFPMTVGTDFGRC